jgi:hypothetical protein
VSATGKPVRKGDVVEVGTEEWPEHRALRHIEKEYAVDDNDPDLEDETATFDDASGMKRRKAGKAKKKK